MTSELYVIVEVTDDSVRGMSVRTFGPFDAAQAEQERRYLQVVNGHYLDGSHSRTFVSRVEMSIE